MSYKCEEYVERIRSIMPAPGWTAWSCFINEEGKVDFSEESVVGWAVKGHEAIYGENDSTIERRDDEVVLLIQQRGMGCVLTVDEANEGASNYVVEGVGPNGLTEGRKEQMEETLRMIMRMRAEKQQKKQAAAAAK